MKIAVGAAPRDLYAVSSLKEIGITHWAHHGRKPLLQEILASTEHIDLFINPAPDDGQSKPVGWYERTLRFAAAAKSADGSLFVSCSRGEHRGPSVAYAILRVLLGMQAVDAERCLRNAGFETPVRYASDVESHLIELQRVLGRDASAV